MDRARPTPCVPIGAILARSMLLLSSSGSIVDVGDDECCLYHLRLFFFLYTGLPLTVAVTPLFLPPRRVRRGALGSSLHAEREGGGGKHLVGPLEWRDGLAFVLVQRVADDGPVAELRLALRLLLPAERVLHPVDVVSLLEVLAGVRAA